MADLATIVDREHPGRPDREDVRPGATTRWKTLARSAPEAALGGHGNRGRPGPPGTHHGVPAPPRPGAGASRRRPAGHRRQRRGGRHSWAFNAYVLIMAAPFRMIGFVMIQWQRASAAAQRPCSRSSTSLRSRDHRAPPRRAVALSDPVGRVELDNVTFAYTTNLSGNRGRHPRDRGLRLGGGAGRDGCGGGPHRQRQEHHRPAAAPLLRRGPGRGAHRRHRRPGPAPVGSAQSGDRGDRRARSCSPPASATTWPSPGPTPTRHRWPWPSSTRPPGASWPLCPPEPAPSSASGARPSPGGQRQRLAIARALLADPAVLVLDDATSAIDSEVEERIHAALRERRTQRTTILIAHRLSTIALADRVVFISAGKVAATGSHRQLLANRPRVRTGPHRHRGHRRRRRWPPRRPGHRSDVPVAGRHAQRPHPPVRLRPRPDCPTRRSPATCATGSSRSCSTSPSTPSRRCRGRATPTSRTASSGSAGSCGLTATGWPWPSPWSPSRRSPYSSVRS